MQKAAIRIGILLLSNKKNPSKEGVFLLYSISLLLKGISEMKWNQAPVVH